MTVKILSSRGRKANKPAKPRKDSPLFAHDSGQWAKKVRGKLYYFGTWDDPVAAESRWERDKHALIDGRNPGAPTAGDSIRWLCNTFMDSKELQRQRGELTKRALDDYHRVAKSVAKHFGKGRRLETIRANEFSLEEVHERLAVAGVPMRAFILLGINCAYGTADIARLKEADINFDGQWLGEPRGKTGMARGCWLWSETVAAMREAIAAQPFATVPRVEGLAFLTRNRRPWAEDGSTSHPQIEGFTAAALRE